MVLLWIYIFLLITLCFFLSTPPSPPSSRKEVRIILSSKSKGLVEDAKVYARYIPNAYILELDPDLAALHPEANVATRINLYLEAPVALDYFPCKERWLMANQEFFFLDYFNQVDVILAKTRYAEKLLSDYLEKSNLSRPQIAYVGHTSLLQGSPNLITKDWDLCVHFAGKSPYKGTKLLIEVWQENRGFRHLVPNSCLVITCREGCWSRVNCDLEWYSEGNYWSDPATGLQIYSYLDEAKTQELKRTAGVFICPSTMEGYGHYINEGLANAAVVITTDFPPMNELVVEETFLVPPAREYPSWQELGFHGFFLPLFDLHLPGSKACTPDRSSLFATIATYLSLTREAKIKLGQANYNSYLKQQRDFKGRLHDLVTPL